MVDVTEDLVVSEEWIQGAGFKPGVVQHVVNLGSADGSFLPIPGGKSVVFHREKGVQYEVGASFCQMAECWKSVKRQGNQEWESCG